MKVIYKLFYLIAIFFFMFSTLMLKGNNVYAQGRTTAPQLLSQVDFDNLYNTTGLHFRSHSTIGDIISHFLVYFFPFAGLIFLLLLIVGGFKFMTSAGDPKAAQSAKSVITAALIGFILIFLAYWITRIVATVLGLGQIESIF